jgi:DNA-binding transcriptional ArsR family regulator
MDYSLSPVEERVLGILIDRSELDVTQIAGAGLLSVESTTHALNSLADARLVSLRRVADGTSLYELNGPVAKDITAAA